MDEDEDEDEELVLGGAKIAAPSFRVPTWS
jgi:hypothetical protein